jgi:hypothetical protein
MPLLPEIEMETQEPSFGITFGAEAEGMAGLSMSKEAESVRF